MATRSGRDARASTLGPNVCLHHERHSRPYVMPPPSFQFQYFEIRKLRFRLRARALHVLRGGFVKMGDLLGSLRLVQTHKVKPVPAIVALRDRWRWALDPGFVVQVGLMDPEHRDLIWSVETAQEIQKDILRR